jgi:hypothetical protein
LLTIYRSLLFFLGCWIFPPDGFFLQRIQSDTSNPLTTMNYCLFARVFPHGRHPGDGATDSIRPNGPKKRLPGSVRAAQETLNRAR